MAEHKIPWRVVVTIPSLVTVAITALYVGQTELAAAAIGGLIGYLGKLNGRP